MSKYKYSATVNDHRAKAVGLLMPISIKQSIEICNLIRGKNLQKAKKILTEAKDMKKPIPFTRFTEGAGHKHGIGPGKYPVKACTEILKLVNLVEANAQHKGLDTSSLVIIHICTNQGPKSWHYGRQSRIAMKRTHVEIVVEEKEVKKKDVAKETKKPAEKVEKKQVEEEEPKLKKEQSKEIKKPAEEKEDKSQSKQEPRKVLKKKNVPTAAELAEKAKSEQESKKVPAIKELTKKKTDKK